MPNLVTVTNFEDLVLDLHHLRTLIGSKYMNLVTEVKSSVGSLPRMRKSSSGKEEEESSGALSELED